MAKRLMDRAAAGTTRTQDFGTEVGRDSVPIVEERLTIGNWLTALNRMRVRSYVVETPGKEHVTLRNVRGELERRPVDRPLSAGTDPVREQTIEAADTAEEAIVIKEARVKQEVVVCKEAEERTQTVSDTARRIELKAYGQRRGAGTCTTSTETTRKSAVGSAGMGPTKTKVDERH